MVEPVKTPIPLKLRVDFTGGVGTDGITAEQEEELALKVAELNTTENLRQKSFFPGQCQTMAVKIQPSLEYARVYALERHRREMGGLLESLLLQCEEVSSVSYKLEPAKAEVLTKLRTGLEQLERVACDVLQCQMGEARNAVVNGIANPFYEAIYRANNFIAEIRMHESKLSLNSNLAPTKHLAIEPVVSSGRKGLAIAITGTGFALAAAAAVAVAFLPKKIEKAKSPKETAEKVENKPEDDGAVGKSKVRDGKNIAESRER